MSEIELSLKDAYEELIELRKRVKNSKKLRISNLKQTNKNQCGLGKGLTIRMIGSIAREAKMTSEQDTLTRLPLLRDLTYREWHGFVDGAYCGARWGARSHEYEREQHYWRGGYLLGTTFRYVFVLWLLARIRDAGRDGGDDDA